MATHNKAVVPGSRKQPSGVLPVGLVLASSSMLWMFHRLHFTNEWIPGKFTAVFGSLHWAGSAAREVYFSLLKIVICAAPFVLCETLFDKSKILKCRRHYLFPIRIWTISLSLSCVSIFVGVKIRLLVGITPLLDRFSLSNPVKVMIWILAIDFLGYLCHRLEHRVPLLWRIHSTHHAIENLNSINQYSHWFESMVRILLVTTPLALLSTTPALELTVVTSVYAIWTAYTHCDRPEARLPKWATHVLIDNVYHRYHHGKEEGYHDSNYGNMFSFWDRLFGTITSPTGDDFPETGLNYLPPPKNLKAYMSHALSLSN